VAGLRQSPFWPALEGIAHTIAYDGRIMGSTMSGRPLPADRWAAVKVPTLVMYGRDTEPWLIAAARALADLLPTASLQAVEGAQHNVEAGVLAPVLRQFALAEQASTGLWLGFGDVVAALVGGVHPHPHDGARAGVAEPLVRGDPAGGGLVGVRVPAPPPGPPRRAGSPRADSSRQVGDCRGRLVQVLGAQHHADPAVQLVQAEQPHRVVLAQQPDQPLAIGVGGQRPRDARTGHRYPAGRTTTAVP
jgi:hypothetical protein